MYQIDDPGMLLRMLAETSVKNALREVPADGGVHVAPVSPVLITATSSILLLLGVICPHSIRGLTLSRSKSCSIAVMYDLSLVPAGTATTLPDTLPAVVTFWRLYVPFPSGYNVGCFRLYRYSLSNRMLRSTPCRTMLGSGLSGKT